MVDEQTSNESLEQLQAQVEKEGLAEKTLAPPQNFMGMPMRWDKEKMFYNLWNKDDDRLFPPKFFGIGWDLNFHALGRRLGFIKPPSKKKRRSKK